MEPAVEEAAEEGRPARRFAQAPSWPKQAFEPRAVRMPVVSEPVEEEATPVEATEESPAVTAPAVSAVMATPAEEAKPAFCAACGKPLVEGAPFCPYCGTRVGEAPKAATVVAAPVVAAPVVEEKPVAAPAPSKAYVSTPAPRVEEPEEEEDEEEEETPVVVTSTPARSRFGRSAIKAEDYKKLYDEDDEEEEEEYDEDLDDEDLDEEEDYDEDYDDEDEDDEDDSRGKAGTIVFWILIVVLLLLIAGIAFYFVKAKNIRSMDDLKAFISGKPVVQETIEATPAPEQTTEDVVIPAPTISGSITETYMDDGSEGFMVDVTAPAGSKLHIVTSVALQMDTVTIGEGGRSQIKVPKAVFQPDDYAETDTVAVSPNMEIIEPDGNVTKLELPDVLVHVAPLSLTLSEPVGEEVELNMDGSPLTITGVVDDDYAEVTVNGESVLVYSGGNFQTTVDMKLNEGETGAIEIVARKVNRVTARKVLTVKPYEIKEMDLEVTTAFKDLRAAADGALTVTGTVTPGATVTMTSTSADVTCGNVVVTESGTFSCPITIKKDAYGLYLFNVSAKAEGYTDKEVSFMADYVAKSPNTYRNGASLIGKVYDSITSGSMKEGPVVFTGKVMEIISKDPYTVVKFQTTDKKEVIIVNRSAKNVLDEKDIGKSKQVAGPLVGLYEDTQTPYMWGWFIWNK